MTELAHDEDDAHEVLLSLSDWAARHGHGFRSAQRYVTDGRVPGASKDRKGRWQVPADAGVLDVDQAMPRAELEVVGGRTSDVRQADARTPDVRLGAPLGVLLTLEQAAQLLGTSVGGVRRLADDGLVSVGRWGERGGLRVFVAPR